MAKLTTKTKKKVSAEIALKITPDSVMRDQELFEACLFLASVTNRKPRRPCVRKAVIDQLKQTGIMLLALDGDLKETLQLLDKDAAEDQAERAALFGGQRVKPLKRKKAVARRR